MVISTQFNTLQCLYVLPNLGLCKGLVNVAEIPDCHPISIFPSPIGTGYLPGDMAALSQDYISQPPLHGHVTKSQPMGC